MYFVIDKSLLFRIDLIEQLSGSYGSVFILRFCRSRYPFPEINQLGVGNYYGSETFNLGILSLNKPVKIVGQVILPAVN